MTVATSTRMKVPFLLGRFTYYASLYAESSTQVPVILLSVTNIECLTEPPLKGVRI